MRYFLFTICFIMTIINILKIYLNKIHRDKGLSEDLKEFYTLNQFYRWIKYENVKDKYLIIKLIISFFINSFVYFSSFYEFLSSLFPQDILLNSFGMIGIVFLLESIFNIILNYHKTFMIEAKFGFNKMTLKTFVIDELKDFLIDGILMGIIIIFIHYIYEWFSIYGFFIMFIIFMILIMFIENHSLYILKIYNHFIPLKDNHLKDKIEDLVELHGFQIKDIYIMDASKRTTRANAFCLGDKQKVICIDDNMFGRYSDDEILAVFSHELGHAVFDHSHRLKKLNHLRLFCLFIIFIIIFIDPYLYHDFGIFNRNYCMVMTLLNTFVEPLLFLLNIPYCQLSRKSEREADSFTKNQGYGKELKSVLIKLNRNSLSDLMPHPLVVKMMYTHPTLIERIKNIEND